MKELKEDTSKRESTIIKQGDCRAYWQKRDEKKVLNYTLTSDGILTVSGNCALNEVESPDAEKEWFGEDELDYKYSSFQSPFKDLDFHTVVIQPGVGSLGERCLAECKSLKKIIIHDDVIGLKEDFAKGSPVDYYEENGLLFLGTPDNPHHALIGCTDDFCNQNLIIPEGTVTIADYAFAGKGFIRTLSIPNSLKFLGEHTFICTSIKHLHLPDTIVADPEWIMAFDGYLDGCELPVFPLESISFPMSMRKEYEDNKGWYDRLGCTISFHNPDGSNAS